MYSAHYKDISLIPSNLIGFRFGVRFFGDETEYNTRDTSLVIGYDKKSWAFEPLYGRVWNNGQIFNYGKKCKIAESIVLRVTKKTMALKFESDDFEREICIPFNFSDIEFITITWPGQELECVGSTHYKPMKNDIFLQMKTGAHITKVPIEELPQKLACVMIMCNFYPEECGGISELDTSIINGNYGNVYKLIRDGYPLTCSLVLYLINSCYCGFLDCTQTLWNNYTFRTKSEERSVLMYIKNHISVFLFALLAEETHIYTKFIRIKSSEWTKCGKDTIRDNMIITCPILFTDWEPSSKYSFSIQELLYRIKRSTRMTDISCIEGFYLPYPSSNDLNEGGIFVGLETPISPYLHNEITKNPTRNIIIKLRESMFFKK